MKISFPFRPRLIDALRSYRLTDFVADLGAGATVGIIALSLAMSLGIASLPPDNHNAPAIGIYTAIVAGFLVSALGGSRVQIGGPTAAFIPVVVAVGAAYGPDNLVLCTILAGLMLIGFGAARLGTMIKYIPFPVTAGFTAGIAVVIFSTQVKDFLGLTLHKNPGEFIERLRLLRESLPTINWTAVLVATCSFLIIRFWPARLGRRVPASIVVVVLGTVLVAGLHLPVETIGSRYGADAIPQSLPVPHWPAMDFSRLGDLIRPAFTIAVLGAIESLLCAVVADGMIDDRHDSNTELFAQGVANLGSALFGGLPATGAIARTAANVRSGGRTPVAGLVHALTLLGVILAAAPLARFIPLPILSAVLVNVAVNMGEWRNFRRLRRWPVSDAAVFGLTFFLTVVFDITIAVELGMVMAAALFIRRVTETTQIRAIEETQFDEGPQGVADTAAARDLPPGVVLYNIMGAFLFGTADKLETALERSGQSPEVVILRMRQVLAIDATGLQRLEELAERLQRHHRQLILCGPHSQPLFALERHGFLETLGTENVCPDVESALLRAREVMSRAKSPAPDK
jgi:SulP family sulfate permease